MRGAQHVGYVPTVFADLNANSIVSAISNVANDASHLRDNCEKNQAYAAGFNDGRDNTNMRSNFAQNCHDSTVSQAARNVLNNEVSNRVY